MRAAILTTGDEIVTGRIVDTNEAYIASVLDRLGVHVVENRAIRDSRDKLKQTLSELICECEVVIVTGGLGPTLDDITAEAVAQMMGSPVVHHEPTLRKIDQWYQKRGRKLVPASLRMAEYPQEALPLENPAGMAIGFQVDYAKLKGVTNHNGAVFFFPGVPTEMRAMVAQHLEPWISNQNFSQKGIFEFYLFGLPEAMIADRIESDQFDLGRYEFAISYKEGIADVRLVRDEGFSSDERASLRSAVQQLFAEFLLPEGVTSFQELLHRELIQRNQTLAIAESCTGGWICKILTDRPGSSLYLRQGWVTYSNESKERELGVASSLIAEQGAVSEPVVVAMLRGALREARTDFAIAVSGVAGPDGGSPEKPVGTVFIGAASRHPHPEGSIVVKRFQFAGDRDRVRLQSVQQALEQFWVTFLKD